MTGILVADTSVIINGNLAEQIESGSIRDFEIIIPQAVFDELQSQASNRKEQGFIGLEQIQKLNRLSENYGLKIILKGSHPAIDDIKFAASGRIDALIIDIAKQNDAILVFSVGGGDSDKKVSVNIIRALDEAKSRNMKIFGIIGRETGYTKLVGDYVIVIPTIDKNHITPHSEAFQAVVWHCLVCNPSLQTNKTKW